MREYVDKVATNPAESGLTAEERKLLSNAYKTLTGQLRRSWRILNAVEEMEIGKEASPVLRLIQHNKAKILSELRDICHGILEIVGCHLLPNATTADSRVFYHKMSPIIPSHVSAKADFSLS